MNIIMPAGKEKTKWVPEENKGLQKTASTEEQNAEAKEEDDSLYAAAEKYLKDKEEACGVMPDEEVAVVEVAPAEGEIADVAEVIEDIVPEGDVAEAEEVSEELSEGVEETLEEAVEEMKEAIDKVEEAITEQKEEEAVEENEEAEIEIEIEDEGNEEDEEEEPEGALKIEESSPCMAETEAETKESSDEAETVEASEEDNVEKTADSSEEFVRYSKISAPNRKKLKRFWGVDLKYPMDYVNLMVKDYE